MASFWGYIQYENGVFARVWVSWCGITETKATIYTGYLCNSSRISRKSCKYILKVSVVQKIGIYKVSHDTPAHKNSPPLYIYKTALTNILKKLRTSLQKTNQRL